VDHIGIGMLIGIQHGNQLNELDFEREKNRLRQQLAEANMNSLSEMAQKEALKSCISAVVGELSKEADGIPFKPRHSDPNQKAQRVEDFIDTAEMNLHRLSSGQLSFTQSSIEDIKRAERKDVHQVIGGQFGPTLKPQMKPKSTNFNK